MVRHRWPDTAASLAGWCGIVGRMVRHRWPDTASSLAGFNGNMHPTTSKPILHIRIIVEGNENQLSKTTCRAGINTFFACSSM
jgi:hypothetical protein